MSDVDDLYGSPQDDKCVRCLGDKGDHARWCADKATLESAGDKIKELKAMLAEAIEGGLKGLGICAPGFHCPYCFGGNCGYGLRHREDCLTVRAKYVEPTWNGLTKIPASIG